MRHLTAYELEHIVALLTGDSEPDILTQQEQTRLAADIQSELNRRDRAASERNIAPRARAQQYNRNGATVTIFEEPMPAHGVKAPRKRPDGSGVKITDVDALLMMCGELDVPEA